MSDWKVFRGDGHPRRPTLPEPPGWRRFDGSVDPEEEPLPHEEGAARRLGNTVVGFSPDGEEVLMVNAAIHLRRALLITGDPGIGKSTLAYVVARELGLGPVLRWPITTRATLQDGLYRYDPVGRLYAAQINAAELQTPSLAKKLLGNLYHRAASEADPKQQLENAYRDIGRFLQLGPLGTALLPSRRPRVILIDEIDKGDLDFPNDLLNVLEEGEFIIPELVRHERAGRVPVRTSDVSRRATIEHGRLLCNEFPLVFITSNGEREFPPAFLRRCLRLDMKRPDSKRLAQLVTSHMGEEVAKSVTELITNFADDKSRARRAPDQLLNAVFMIAGHSMTNEERQLLEGQLLRPLQT